MSGNKSEWINPGEMAFHNGKPKKIVDYYFTSDGTHNGDIIVVRFDDGTECEGERDISPATDSQIYLYELKQASRKKALAKRRKEQFSRFYLSLREHNVSYKTLAIALFKTRGEIDGLFNADSHSK